MFNKTNITLGGAIIAIVLSILGLFGGNNQQTDVPQPTRLGGMTNYDGITITPVLSTDGFKLGTNGTLRAEEIRGTCTLIAGTGGSGIDASQPASSTRPYDCAVTGVVSGDVVSAQLSTTTILSGNNGSWSIEAAGASTTAGFITVLLRNNGAAAVPSATGVGSSTSYLVTDITPP